MRSTFIILLSSFIIYSCGSNRQVASQQPSPESADRMSTTVKAEDQEPQVCEDEVPGVKLSKEEAARYENLIRQNGYNNNISRTQPRTNLNGAAGPGTGSSYASSYYGSQTKKEPKKVCKPSDKVTVKDVPEENEGNYHTTSGWDEENQFKSDDQLHRDTSSVTEQETEDAWLNDEWSDEEWQNQENQNEEVQDEDAWLQEEEEVEYDEVPW